METNSTSHLIDEVSEIGYFGQTNADEAFIGDRKTFVRCGVEKDRVMRLVVGSEIRDWQENEGEYCLFPYSLVEGLLPLDEMPLLHKWLWPYRTNLGNRATFSKNTYFGENLPWWKWHQVALGRLSTPLTIVYSEQATHNHFVLDRGGKLFKKTAPMIKLSSEATKSHHLHLFGLLNCSSGCYWMKQVLFPKGGDQVGSEGARVRRNWWDVLYEFAGINLKQFPLAPSCQEMQILAFNIDKHSVAITRLAPTETAAVSIPAPELLDLNRHESIRLRTLMIALQEELDWLCYRLYGLSEDDRSLEWPLTEGEPPGLNLGERTFEIAMARQMAAGELQTGWFERHGSTPITEIPQHWPEAYRALVQRRLDAIRDNPYIALIERPEYKRRWLCESWDDQVKRALRSWLLDRLESDRYWPDAKQTPPELTSCSVLAERAQHDADFLQVAALYAGRPDFALPALVAELVAAESVPFLPVLRYKPSGLVKRQVWERTWDLQRREDAGEDVGTIPVPPKYASADFASSDAWRLRGKLDVPKERWISYPHCARDGDPSLVVGWAGWDHLQQATALAGYYDRMKTREGWQSERLVPLLAGLDQLVFWLQLWHNEVDPEFDLRMGDYYRDFIRDEAQALGYTLEQVRSWEPPAKSKRPRK